MRDYVKVPPAQNGPTVGLPYGKADNTQPPTFHTASNRSYAPVVDNYPEASGLLQGASRTAQRFAGAVAVNRGVEAVVEGATSSLRSPADHLRSSEGPGGEFMRREIGKREWFDKVVDRSRPAATPDSPSAGLPARSAHQPAISNNLPTSRPRMYRGAEAISSVAALGPGAAGVSRPAPVPATYARQEPLAIGPGPSVAPETPQRPQTRTQRRSGKQSEALPGVDWSKY